MHPDLCFWMLQIKVAQTTTGFCLLPKRYFVESCRHGRGTSLNRSAVSCFGGLGAPSNSDGMDDQWMGPEWRENGWVRGNVWPPKKSSEKTGSGG